jgi:capsular exopolysaccharide synthesis family protein
MKQEYHDIDELKSAEKEESDKLKKKLIRLLRVWPLFLISLVVCLSLSYLYLRYTHPVYQAMASLMVKDENKGADLIYNKALEEIGLGVNTKLIENEIELLKSYDLMESVVDTLKLFVSVKKADKVKGVALFGDEIPFSLEIIDPKRIQKTRNWKIIDSAGTLFFQNENDEHTTRLQYENIYNAGGLSFRCLPGSMIRDSLLKKEQNYTHVYKIEINSRAQTVLRYSNNLKVDPASKAATVINLRVKDTNEKRAVAVLQAMISIFQQQGVENKNLVMDNTIDFLNQRLAAVAGELRGVEGSVEQFKSVNKVTDLSADAQQYLTSAQQVDEQKAENQTQLNIINALETDLIQNQDNPKIVPSTFGINDPSLGSLIEKHNDLVLQKERLQEKSGPKNPLLIEQQNQIKDLRIRLLTNVRNLKQAYTITQADINRKDAQLSNRIRHVPQMEKKLLQITRNQNVQEQLYAFLLQKREEAAVSRLSVIEDSRVIVNARSLGVVSPKTNLIWLTGLLLGLLFPFAFIGMKDFMNNKVGDIAQVKHSADIPLLGIISHVKKRLKPPIVLQPDSHTVVSDQIRNIRTYITLAGQGQEIKTILVTSFQPGDGKSFVSMNLAAGYALMGKKTVILEFDLRRPKISAYFGLENSEGITNILNENENSAVNERLVEITGYNNNLFLLPAGPHAPNPAELISGQTMNCLIKTMKERFDYIVIDTPSISLVPETTLLQQYADISLVVLRQDHTSREVYNELQERIKRYPGNPIYLLLNDVGKRRRYRGVYGYGGYGYGYGYGKGYYQKNK